MKRLIDANVLIEECNNVIEEVDAGELKEDYYDGYDDGVENIRDFAEHMPTIEAEPVRHGKWIWKGEEGDSRWMCSECKCKEYVPTCNGVPNIWDYCPNCGARMDAE